MIIQPGTLINQTHLHIFQLLPQCISEVTNFQHLQMSWVIHWKDWHLKLMVFTILYILNYMYVYMQAPVVLTTTYKANDHCILDLFLSVFHLYV